MAEYGQTTGAPPGDACLLNVLWRNGEVFDQREQARVFRALHTQRPLVLPNAWDPGSAVAIEAAGAKAIATTSAGVSWAKGVPDGGGLSRADALNALRRIVDAVSV